MAAEGMVPCWARWAWRDEISFRGTEGPFAMHKTLLTLGIWLIAGLAWANSKRYSAQRGQNWQQWRGPLATGVAPLANPPVQWDENTNIKWKVPIPGESSATPIVWHDQIFLVTSIKTDR